MKIVTYADAKFLPILKITQSKNGAMGYRVHPYFPGRNVTLPERWRNYQFGEWPERVRGKLPFKPWLIKKALTDSFQETAWLDADAIIVKPIDGIWADKGFDLAVTLRRFSEREQTEYKLQYGYTNAGVIFARYRPATMRFLDSWITMVGQTESCSDQEALNKLLLQCNELEQTGKTITHGTGARIKMLTTDEWNWYYWPESLPDTTKIVHLKTDKRKAGLKWATS